jgi:ubiquinone/menaquinone biosynthesis C-methylase UbiE
MDIEKYAQVHPKNKPAKISDTILKDIKRLNKGSKILDIGCAEGATINYLYSLFGKKYDYVGVDLSETRIKKARALRIPNTEFLVSNAENIDLKESSFDCILCSQLLEHVESENNLLKEIHRLLKQDGIFQVDTVFKKKWAWYFYRAPIGWALDPTHLREYSNLKTVKEIFEKADLKVGKIYTTKSYRDLNKVSPIKLKIPIPGYYTLFIEGKK